MGLYQMQLQLHKTWETWKSFLFPFKKQSDHFIWFSGKARICLYMGGG